MRPKFKPYETVDDRTMGLINGTLTSVKSGAFQFCYNYIPGFGSMIDKKLNQAKSKFEKECSKPF